MWNAKSAILLALFLTRLASSFPIAAQTDTPAHDQDDVENGTANPFGMVILHLSGRPIDNEAAHIDGGESKMSAEPVKKPTAATEDHADTQHSPKKGGFAIMSSTSTNSYAMITPMQARSESLIKSPSKDLESESFKKRDLSVNDGEEDSLAKRAAYPSIHPIFRSSAAQLKSSLGVGYHTIAKPTSKGWKRVLKQVYKIREHQQMRAAFNRADDRWASRTPPHRSGEWNGENLHSQFY